MSVPDLTIEEFIETLKRSQLATVITEGTDDYKFFRRIEDTLRHHGVSLMPVGGRHKVLTLFERRKEFRRNNIAFLVDKDLWIFDQVPAMYHHRKIITTNGYSIENDLYSDGDLENLLYDSERQKFHRDIDALVHWYSFAVDRLQRGCAASISEHPNKVISSDGTLNAEYMAEIGFTCRHEDIYHKVMADYKRLIRGKNLINTLVRYLSASGRSTKFGRSHVMELAAARNGPNMQRISTEIDKLFQVL